MPMDTQGMVETKALDRNELVEIYEQYSPMLFRYGYRLTGDKDTAEECVSDTFRRFLDSLVGNPAGPDNVKAYLYRVAHNWVTDYYRRQPPPSVELDEDLHESADNRGNGNPAHLIGDKLDAERIRDALQVIPEEQRQVIALRFLEELKHEDVAASMGKTVEATRAIQYRALNSLRRILLVSEEV